MTLNKNEQLIAWVVGGVLALALTYYGVSGVFATQLEEYNKQITKQKAQVDLNKQVMDKAKRLNAEAEHLGIEEDAAKMGNRVRTGVQSIAQRYRIIVSSWTPMKPKLLAKTDYMEASFKMVATGNTSGVSQFLYSLENAGQPIRVDDLTLGATKPGTDSLQITVTLSALLRRQPPPTPGAARGLARGRGPATAMAAEMAKAAAAAAQTEADMALRRLQVEQRLNSTLAADNTAAATTAPATATAPASEPAPAMSPAQLEAEMAARRARQEQGLSSTPTNAPTPASAPGGVR